MRIEDIETVLQTFVPSHGTLPSPASNSNFCPPSPPTSKRGSGLAFRDPSAASVFSRESEPGITDPNQQPHQSNSHSQHSFDEDQSDPSEDEANDDDYDDEDD